MASLLSMPSLVNIHGRLGPIDDCIGIEQPHHARLSLLSDQKEIRAGKAELLESEPRPSSCLTGEQTG